ncbi:hypothetical protein OSG_eHP27_00175 [environmental Halophage eHP-27]|nr:hypothetical protein OSG_eHP27_00175 [environmental Halophage eHP-27]
MAVPAHPAENEYFHDFGDALAEKAETRAPLDEMPAGTFSSSNVHSALYDYGGRELFIRYKRTGVDAVYQYINVSARVWNGLVQAGSKGSYVNANIAYEFVYSKTGRDTLAEDAARNMQQGRVRRFLATP